MKLFISLLLLLVCLPVEATVKYIRAGVSGLNNGTSWANAYTNLASVTWTRDCTNYIAAGTYLGGVMNANKSGTLWVTLKKANLADNSGDAGWNDSFTNLVTITNQMFCYVGYMRIDGVTGSGTNGHGILIWNANNTSGPILGCADNTSPYEFLHLDIKANGYRSVMTGIDGIKMNAISFQPQKGNHIQYCWIHDLTRNGMTIGNFVGTSYTDYGFILEDSVICRTGALDAANHGQGIAWAFRSNDVYGVFCKIQRNKFYDIHGTGMICMAGNMHDDLIINNEFFISDNTIYTNGISPGVIVSTDNGWTVTNLTIANNVFYNLSVPTTIATIRFENDALHQYPNPTNNYVMNNVWENCYFNFGFVGCNPTNNGFYNCTGSGVPSGTPGQTNGVVTTFVSASTDNFSLLASGYGRQSGVDLSATFTADALGTNRVAPWDLGPYAFYVAGIPPVATNGVSVSALSFTFSRIQSGSQTFYVTNTGGGTLSGLASCATANFTLSGFTNYSLTQGQGSNITVTFGPKAEGTYLDIITLTGGGGAAVGLTGISTNFPTKETIGNVTITGKVTL